LPLECLFKRLLLFGTQLHLPGEVPNNKPHMAGPLDHSDFQGSVRCIFFSGVSDHSDFLE